ncbi:MAG: hypothetical protein JSU63_18895 [Phycisphaerales bacterium]|nr:MAG: hypothetical protein JSU63_18895 [Phycisphaerales bacterium]
MNGTKTFQARSAAGDHAREPGSPVRNLRLRRGDTVWWVEQGWDDRLLDREAPDWLALEQDARAECIKSGHRRATWKVRVGKRAVFAKVHETGGAWDRVRHLIGGNPAWCEWRAASEALRRGVPAIRPLAVGLSAGSPRRSVFLSEGVLGAVSLGDAWPGKSSLLESRPVGRGVSVHAITAIRDAIASLFAAAHERGFVHPDGHPNNVLVRTDSGGEPKAAFVDVKGARLSNGPIPKRRAVRSLAQLEHYFQRYPCRTQRMRFLRTYLAARPSVDLRPPGCLVRRNWATAIARECTRHASRLARGRDRRLRRNGKYFSTLRLQNGWSATVVLKLERRHAFPEPDVPDWSREDWLAVLDLLPRNAAGMQDPGELIRDNRLHCEPGNPIPLLRRLEYVLIGPPQRRIFEQCHMQRHRDVPAELILGYLEHRTCGLIDATALIRPRRATE